MSVYDFTVKNAKGEQVSLSEYRGKVLLIVNTATNCHFTPQYEGLQKLYEKYREKGLEILDFPSNQFGEQAPDSIEEIEKFRSLKSNNHCGHIWPWHQSQSYPSTIPKPAPKCSRPKPLPSLPTCYSDSGSRIS